MAKLRRLKRQPFVHLHAHTEFSFLDALPKVKGLGGTVRSKGFKSYALTDHGNVCGVYSFVKEMEGAGVKPIVGCEFYYTTNRHRRGLTDEQKAEAKSMGEGSNAMAKRLGLRSSSHVVVLAKSNQGWRKLVRALEVAHAEGFYFRPRIDKELLTNMAPDVVVLTACIGGVPSKLISADRWEEALQWSTEMVDVFGDDFYLEIQPNEMEEQVILNPLLIDLAEQSGANLVSTCDVHYVEKEDWETHDVMLAVRDSVHGKRVLVSDPDRFRYTTHQLWMKSHRDVIESFERFHPDIDPEVIKQSVRATLEIDAKIEPVVLRERHAVLPRVVIDPVYKDNPDAALWGLIKKGWKWRKISKLTKDREGIIDWVDGETPTEAPLVKVYEQRIRHEMETIVGQGFSKYFLVMYDLIWWCRDQGIRVGPGRGSVGGSVVAFLLGITSVDSIKYNCPFSRFISPERIDFPDIDTDFPTSERAAVKVYLAEKYGSDFVASICTFSKLKGKAVLKDIGRVYDVPYMDTDKVTQYVIERSDGDERATDCLEDSIRDSPELREYASKYPQVIRHATKLEGNIRQMGVNAAGVVVSDEPLRDMIPVQFQHKYSVQGGKLGDYVCGWDKRAVESVGLLKLDILGIEGLTYIQRSLDLIRERHGVVIEPEEWEELTDPVVFENFCEGNTELVWQMNTFTTVRVLKRLLPESFDHLVATTALIRPGPMNAGITDTYIKRRHGKTTKSLHPLLDEILESTYGLFVYQEDVIKVCHDLGGFTWGEADRIRKDVGKKKGVDYLRRTYVEKFCEGSASYGVKRETAERIWDLISEFGMYGFNRCLSGNTLVYRAGANGNCRPEVSIEDLYVAQGEPSQWGRKIREGRLNIIQMDEDGRMRPGRLKCIHENGRRQVFEITTCSGRHIKCTLNHRLLTNSGYEIVDNLVVGDHLVCMGDYEGRKSTTSSTRGLGCHYDGITGGGGVLFGANNPGWIDGRDVAFKEAKFLVLERSGGSCERCGVEEFVGDRFEFAHSDSLEMCNGNYGRYHSENNVRYLCNSCHKKFDYQKGERKKRWTKGRPSVLDEIISIRSCGIETVYDIEMCTIGHNFIANGIVSHNSHATAYSMLSYWTMWLKIKYPLEFMTAALEAESDKDKRNLYIRESKRLGLRVVQPDVNVSGASYTIDPEEDNLIRAGFIDIKGVGEKAVTSIVESSPYVSLRDFLERCKANKTVVKNLLSVGAFDNLTDEPWTILANLDAVLKVRRLKLKDKYWDALELEAAEPWTNDEMERTRLDLLGLPPEVHPADRAANWLKRHTSHFDIHTLAQYGDLFPYDYSNSSYAFVGVVEKVKFYPMDVTDWTDPEQKVFRKRIARINISDDTGMVDIRIGWRQVEDLGTDALKVGQVLFMVARAEGYLKLSPNVVVNMNQLKQQVKDGGPEPGTPEWWVMNDPFDEGLRELLRDSESIRLIGDPKRNRRKRTAIYVLDTKLKKITKGIIMSVTGMDFNNVVRTFLVWATDVPIFGRKFNAGHWLTVCVNTRVFDTQDKRFSFEARSVDGAGSVMDLGVYLEKYGDRE